MYYQFKTPEDFLDYYKRISTKNFFFNFQIKDDHIYSLVEIKELNIKYEISVWHSIQHISITQHLPNGKPTNYFLEPNCSNSLTFAYELERHMEKLFFKIRKLKYQFLEIQDFLNDFSFIKKIPKNSIICCFPLCGKSTANEKFDNVIDLESSLFMFKDNLIDSKYNGNIESAKGDPNRIRYPDANERYLNAVLDVAQSPIDYVVCSPIILEELLKAKENGITNRNIYMVQPINYPNIVQILTNRAINRGNSKEWINSFIPLVPNFLENNKKIISPEFLVELDDNEFLSSLIIK